MTAWQAEPRAVRDEAGWAAWNGWSPEVAFCDWVGAVVALARPAVVVETGVGQGYVTRRILRRLPPGSRYLGFEAEAKYRAWAPARLVGTLRETPTADDMALADLVVLDSHPPYRPAELTLWLAHARPGTLLVVHDVIPGRAGLKGDLAAVLVPLGGFLTPNPRGGWIGRHP